MKNNLHAVPPFYVKSHMNSDISVSDESPLFDISMFFDDNGLSDERSDNNGESVVNHFKALLSPVNDVIDSKSSVDGESSAEGISNDVKSYTKKQSDIVDILKGSNVFECASQDESASKTSKSKKSQSISILSPSMMYPKNIEHKETSKSLTKQDTEETTEDDLVTAPPFFDSDIDVLNAVRFEDGCWINKKIPEIVRAHISVTDLRLIDSDIDVAREKIILFLSMLPNGKFIERTVSELPSLMLKGMFGDSYYSIVRALIKGTKKFGAIITKSDSYSTTKHQCYRYGFTEKYYDIGSLWYEFKTNSVLTINRNQKVRMLNKGKDNHIAQMMLSVYHQVTYPSIEEITATGKALSKSKSKDNKGKQYKFIGKKGRSSFDEKKFRFIEDDIEYYKLLTEHGLMVPIIGDYKSGGRVVDSFTLMPKWIRQLIKIKGQEIDECDYTALHPNIIMRDYGGDDVLSGDIHTELSEKFGADRKEIKVQHLSFFNKRVVDMEKDEMYSYYETLVPETLETIIYNKNTSIYRYKVTFYETVKTEVDMMLSVCSKLLSEGISVLYVYDALYSAENDSQRVSEVMNEVAIEFKVKTEVN